MSEGLKHYLELFVKSFLFKLIFKFSGSAIIRKSSSPKIFPLCPSLYTFQIGPDDVKNPDIRELLEAKEDAILYFKLNDFKLKSSFLKFQF